MADQQRVVVIPESILCTIVFPRILHAFTTSGSGQCWLVTSEKCDMWRISTRVSAFLQRCLPSCGEPGCMEKGIHYCASGQAICCRHAKRFGFMHQIRKLDGKCLCSFKNGSVLDMLGSVRKVTCSEWKGMLFITLWERRQWMVRYNLCSGRRKRADDRVISSKGENAVEWFPDEYLALLYHFAQEVEEYIWRRRKHAPEPPLKMIKL